MEWRWRGATGTVKAIESGSFFKCIFPWQMLAKKAVVPVPADHHQIQPKQIVQLCWMERIDLGLMLRCAWFGFLDEKVHNNKKPFSATNIKGIKFIWRETQNMQKICTRCTGMIS